MELTLQLHKPHTITKMTEVVPLKFPHCHIKYIVIGISKILQINFDIPQELVILGEYCNDRDWSRYVKQFQQVLMTTYHSCQGKCPQNTSCQALVVGCPLGHSTFKT
jgi:hypothetical protein